MQTAGSVSKTKAVCESIAPMMAHHRVDAYLVPSSDEHLNEYLPEAHKRREFLTNFSGSAGDALLLSEELAKSPGEKPVFLTVDSRYYEQADLEVDLETVNVSKLGLDGHPRLSDKIVQLAKLKQGLRLGFDPYTVSYQMFQDLEKQCQSNDVTLVPVAVNLIDAAWGAERPTGSLAPVYSIPVAYTGQTVEDKIARVRKHLKETRTALLPVTKLDQVAWLLNWRGQDIPYNPVFMAYVILLPEETLVFCDDSRIEADAKHSLPKAVRILPYREYSAKLNELATGKRVSIDPKHVTYGTIYVLNQCRATVVTAESPIENDKAIKNETELNWMRQAHIKSAKGKIRALHWLHQQLEKKQTISEKAFADVLEARYSEEEGYKGLSFNTIAGAGANSSIVHYGTPSDAEYLTDGQLFLIDSGVQYLGGTTDDTRTIAVGRPTDLQKTRFTEVLKAHINCAMQIFPKGTEGARLDGITRASLWQQKMDYGHGTGHGVGAFLNVHEGPCGIHRLASKALLPGMVVSIEPGYYEPGWGGIRCENLYTVVDKGADEQGVSWYGFESLTYIPFDNNLIDETRLNAEQQQWLKDYHAAVASKIAPLLSNDEAAWLKSVL